MSDWTRGFCGVLLLAASVGLGGCHPTLPGTRPDEMSAARHRDEANKHREVAEQHRKAYAAEMGDKKQRGASGSADPGEGFRWPMTHYDPRERHLNTAWWHERYARKHERAARKLEKYSDRKCRDFPAKTRALCPLVGGVERIESIDGGVRLHVAQNVPLGAVEDHIACHMAFARSQGYEGEPTCPLYVRGVNVKVRTRRRVIELIHDDPAGQKAVRDKAATHVPTASDRQPAPTTPAPTTLAP